MKQNLILSLLLLFSLTSWAQYNDASTSKEELKIPIKPIVVEGELTNVPDGTPVNFVYRVKRENSFSGNLEMRDTVRNGKFHIEKKYVYLDSDDSKANEDYLLTAGGTRIHIYANHGDTVKVTGNGFPCYRWRAESHHPLQKVLNDYRVFKNSITDPISKKIREAYEADNVDDELIDRLEIMRDSTDIASSLDYMKDKEFNSAFASELMSIAIGSYTSKRKGILSDKISDFIKEKVPDSYKDDEYIWEAKRYSASADGKLHVGDKMPGYTLYDRDGKEHKLSEFVGKKIVLLEFSTKSCGPCQAIKPEMEEFYAKHKKKLEIITISCDNVETWKSEKTVSWSDWNDHNAGITVGEKIDVSGYPYFVIIRPDGVIGSTFLGIGKVREYFKTFDF